MAVIIICLVMVNSGAVHAVERHAISLQYVGFSIHPRGGILPEIYPLKLDKKAYTIVEIGFALNYDYIHGERLVWRLAAAVYKDCALMNAGYFHSGPRWTFISSGHHAFAIGIGPTLFFRRDWHRFSEYEGDSFYGDNVYRGWQYGMQWLAGEMDYYYEFRRSRQLHLSFIPAYPWVLSFKLGLRYKF